MTLEEVIAKMTAMQAEMDAREVKAETEREKLRGKIGELIVEKKKLKAKLPPKDEDDEGEDDEAPKGRKSSDPDLARIQREHEAKLTKLQNELDAAKKDRDTASISTALGDALTQANIAPEYRSAVEALLRTKRKVEVTADGVLFDGKSASDSVSEWAKTEGRAFVKAPASGGSAASGVPRGNATSTEPRSKMSAAQKGAYIRDHGQDAYLKLPM